MKSNRKQNLLQPRSEFQWSCTFATEISMKFNCFQELQCCHFDARGASYPSCPLASRFGLMNSADAKCCHQRSKGQGWMPRTANERAMSPIETEEKESGSLCAIVIIRFISKCGIAKYCFLFQPARKTTSMATEDNEFYERLLRGASVGRLISDPCLSSTDRSRLLELGSSQWLEDIFHRRLSEKHPDDSILRRNRNEEKPPCSNVFCSSRRRDKEQFRFQQYVDEQLAWKHEEQTSDELRTGDKSVVSDLDLSNHSEMFWRLDENNNEDTPLPNSEELSVANKKDCAVASSAVLPALERNRLIVKRKKSNKTGDPDRSFGSGRKARTSKRHGVSYFSFYVDLPWIRGRRKLLLEHMNLEACDIPLGDLVGTALGSHLTCLSLAGNPLGSIPSSLVRSLPSLKSLDLSQCSLLNESLPSKWCLPRLTRLDLSHNRLTEFPDKVSCVIV